MLVRFGGHEGIKIGCDFLRYVSYLGVMDDDIYDRGTVIAVDDDEVTVDFSDWVEVFPKEDVSFCMDSLFMAEEHFMTVMSGRITRDYRRGRLLE